MLPIIAAEMLVQDRQRTVVEATARGHLRRSARAANGTQRRGRLGWLLVRAGVWLARADLVATEGSTVQIVRPRPGPPPSSRWRPAEIGRGANSA